MGGDVVGLRKMMVNSSAIYRLILIFFYLAVIIGENGKGLVANDIIFQ